MAPDASATRTVVEQDSRSSASPRMPDKPRAPRAVRGVVLALAAIYATYFSFYTCILHALYHTQAYDLGTFDQGIWLAGHGSDLFVTVRGLHLLGDHVRLISFVLAPLYWIWDDVRALLVLQSIAIAAGAWFVCRIAQRELPDRPWLALSLSAGWLLHPAVQNLNLDHAHPDAFASTFVLASVDFLRGGRLLPFWLAAILAMSCKEDVSLVFVALGVVLMLDPSRRRFGCVLATAAGAWFVVALGVVLPMFNGVGFFRFHDGGFLAGLGTHGSEPSWILARLFRWESLSYLFSIGAPQLFLFLMAPLWLLPALPALAANLLSDAPYMRSLYYHYQTMILPFLFVATTDALARMVKWAQQRATRPPTPTVLRVSATRLPGIVEHAAAVALFAAVMACNNAWSRIPIHRADGIVEMAESVSTTPRFAAIRDMLALIPDDAVVSAETTLVPHLSHRRGIYLFPNPFRDENWGVRGENPHDPKLVEYIVVRDRIGSPKVTDQLPAIADVMGFEKIAGGDDMALYRSFDRESVGTNASCGDWDGDGVVDDRDLRRIAYAITQGRECPAFVCDADGDGKLRLPDASRVMKRVADATAPLDCPR